MTYQRSRKLFEPGAPFKLSRSKLELFVQCPRCFYLDRRYGIGQPGGLPFTLNSAVDALLKKEFDVHRAKKQSHPLMKTYGIDAIPLEHPMIDEWRENFKGITYFHPSTQLTITGAVDDIWVNKNNQLHIVDYKATSTQDAPTLDAEYRKAYKRQMEIYQWLFRKNGFDVSDTGYFVYANGKRDRKAFDAKLEFDIDIIPYTGNDQWVEKTILDAYECLSADGLPSLGADCQFCAYRQSVKLYED